MSRDIIPRSHDAQAAAGSLRHRIRLRLRHCVGRLLSRLFPALPLRNRPDHQGHRPARASTSPSFPSRSRSGSTPAGRTASTTRSEALLHRRGPRGRQVRLARDALSDRADLLLPRLQLLARDAPALLGHQHPAGQRRPRRDHRRGAGPPPARLQRQPGDHRRRRRTRPHHGAEGRGDAAARAARGRVRRRRRAGRAPGRTGRPDARPDRRPPRAGADPQRIARSFSRCRASRTPTSSAAWP